MVVVFSSADSPASSSAPSQPTLLKYPGFSSPTKSQTSPSGSNLKIPAGNSHQLQQTVLDTSAFWKNKAPTETRPVLFGLSNANTDVSPLSKKIKPEESCGKKDGKLPPSGQTKLDRFFPSRKSIQKSEDVDEDVIVLD